MKALNGFKPLLAGEAESSQHIAESPVGSQAVEHRASPKNKVRILFFKCSVQPFEGVTLIFELAEHPRNIEWRDVFLGGSLPQLVED